MNLQSRRFEAGAGVGRHCSSFAFGESSIKTAVRCSLSAISLQGGNYMEYVCDNMAIDCDIGGNWKSGAVFLSSLHILQTVGVPYLNKGIYRLGELVSWWVEDEWSRRQTRILTQPISLYKQLPNSFILRLDLRNRLAAGSVRLSPQSLDCSGRCSSELHCPLQSSLLFI